MKDGKCPHCGAVSVYSSTQGIRYSQKYGQGVYVENLGERIGTPIPYQTYICTKCGYFANYVFDQTKLNKIEQTWKKVGE
jgi:ribosomal protein S27AE